MKEYINKKILMGVITLVVLALIIAGFVVFIPKSNNGVQVFNSAAKDESGVASAVWVWEDSKKADAFTLTFDPNGHVSGTTDCNNFTGSYSVVDDGGLSFSQLASTRMFCMDSQEEEFTSALLDVDHYSFDDSDNLVLSLKADSGELRFKKK